MSFFSFSILFRTPHFIFIVIMSLQVSLDWQFLGLFSFWMILKILRHAGQIFCRMFLDYWFLNFFFSWLNSAVFSFETFGLLQRIRSWESIKGRICILQCNETKYISKSIQTQFKYLLDLLNSSHADSLREVTNF